MDKMRLAVIGCGAISDIYLQNMMGRFHRTLQVVGCCATTREHADAKAKKYGIRSMTLDEILADRDIELVVNLTPPAAHAALIEASLNAGKHVYTEKTITGSYAQAQRLNALAQEKGLFLAAAPDTFLGEALQTARKAVDSGLIGQITGFHMCCNRNNGCFYEKCEFTRAEGNGIAYDIGIYYLTALLSILGPAAEVFGKTRRSRPLRTGTDPQFGLYGKPYEVKNDNIASAVIELQCGATGTLHLNGDTAFPTLNVWTLFGTDGILKLPDPNQFGGAVQLCRQNIPHGESETVTLPGSGRFAEDCRGVGVADMADAIRHNRPPRAGAEMAIHALEALDGITASSQTGLSQALHTRFHKPEPMWTPEPWMTD